jgi:hypothetical protein
MTADNKESFIIDFVSMSVVWARGFSCPIVAMIDRFDMETDDPQEADEILVEMPPDGLVVSFLMDDIRPAIKHQQVAN